MGETISSTVTSIVLALTSLLADVAAGATGAEEMEASRWYFSISAANFVRSSSSSSMTDDFDQAVNPLHWRDSSREYEFQATN